MFSFYFLKALDWIPFKYCQSICKKSLDWSSSTALILILSLVFMLIKHMLTSQKLLLNFVLLKNTNHHSTLFKLAICTIKARKQKENCQEFFLQEKC